MIRTVARAVLAISYAAAGVLHLALPEPFLTIVPPWVPAPEDVVFWTGIAELGGAAAIAQPFSPALRKVGAVGLAAYAVCVFPANIRHFALDLASEGGGLGYAYHAPRMFAQPVIVWLALWSGGVVDWPFRRRR